MLQLNLFIIRRFVLDYSAELGLSDTTIKNKTNAIKRLSRFLGDSPLTPENCREYFARLRRQGWQPSSLANEIKTVRALVNFLFKRRYIKQSFAKELLLPKIPKKLLDIVSAEVAEDIIIAGTEPSRFSNRLALQSKIEARLALRFALRTGLRVSELVGLRGEDLNFSSELFSVKSKGGNIDVLPLPPDMIPELQNRINGKVFKVNSETLNAVVNRGRIKLGISYKLTCHSLRHIFCTSLLKNNIPLQIVSRLMRHSSIKITDSTYSHYQLSDLTHALVTGHPLVRQAMSNDDWLKAVRSAIEKTGVMDTGRFNLSSDSSGVRLTVSSA